MSLPLDLVVEPVVDAQTSTATDRFLMRAVRRGQRGAALRIYAIPGDVLWLGRYHLSPGSGAAMPTPDAKPPARPCRVWRRHSGGRALPFGDGFVGLSLVLPHRSTWFGDDPATLAAQQVPNRYVRGVMEAFRRLGVAVYYPGRDLLTANRRGVAAVSFETDEHGVLLFEMVIALTRDFGVLPEFLDAADRTGVVKSQMVLPGDVSSLERELTRSVSFEELAELIPKGFEQAFGVQVRTADLTPLERQAITALEGREMSEASWVHGVARRPDLDRYASSWVQLGALEAFYALRQERFITDVRFAGDFIANSSGVEALQRALRLCPLEWRAINDVTNEVFSHPENFLLGVGKLRAVADTLTQTAEQ